MQPVELLTVDQVADRLAVGRWQVYALLREAQLPGGKVRRLWRVPLDAVERFVAGGGSAAR